MDEVAYTDPTAEEMNSFLHCLMHGINKQAFQLFGDRVVSGPFAGMVIPEKSPWDDGNVSTKLLGCYEHELHESIQYAVWRRPSVIINVGCAEGYYAIGLARLMTYATVYAFDIAELSRLLCEDYAKRNGVKVNLIEGVKAPEELRLTQARGHRLYVIDCEGSELELIDLDKCPELIHSDIIVECHDFMKPNASLTLADRLCRTHRVELIRPQLPDLGQFQFLKQAPGVLSMLMVTEKRPYPCYWLACWAHSKETGNV